MRTIVSASNEQRHHERANEVGTFVQLLVDACTVTLELSDAEHFNAFSAELGEDMRHAVQHICALSSVTSVVLQGAGSHFSVGGNPYTVSGSIVASASSAAFSLRELYDGFVKLRTLLRPVVGAVHGTLVGGGVAGCLHAD